MHATKPTQADIRVKIIHAIEAKYRRFAGRSGTFEYPTPEDAQRAVEALGALGVEASFRPHGERRTVRVDFDPHQIEQVVDAALAAGGKFDPMRRDAAPHDNPTSDDDGYRMPAGLERRFQHIAKIRKALENASLRKIDYCCTREGQWQVTIGSLTLTVASPPEDVEDQLGEIDEAERLFRLVSRLTDLLE